MHTLKSKSGISRGATAAIIIVVIAIIVLAGVLVTVSRPTTKTTTTTTSTTTTSTTTTSTTVFTLSPANSSVLVDDSQTSTPDDLDPATGFYTFDQPVFTNVFQQLVEFNGSNYLEVVPALASNYTTNNYQVYVFQIRPGVSFSNGDPLNAYDVWFSFVRELYLGQAVGISNYQDLTVNLSELSATGLILPWGIRHAVQYAFGLNTLPTPNQTTTILNQVLSNFNPSNTTTQKLMSYPNQAYVVTGPMTFKVNLLAPYRFFLQDIAAWWGAIVDPAYVDAHGGVQYGVSNSYFDANGGPGTGPYEIVSVAPGFATVVLKANPNYWGAKVSGLPPILQPAKIPVIIINYGLSHSDRVEDFATNKAQISYVSIPFLGQMYSAYQYKQYYSFNQIFLNLGFYPAFFYISMNTQKFLTSNNDFRLAIVHAINYTQMLDKLYTYDGQSLGQMYVGPITPQFPEYYNPGNLPIYQYNINLAATYLNKSLYQLGYHTTMPNGTVLGNTSDPQFPTQVITYITPLTPFEQEQLELIQADLEQIGISVEFQGVTPSVEGSWTTPQQTPEMVDLGWVPDWPDPIFQELAPAVTTTSYLPAWMNVTKINQIVSELPFETNTTQQLQQLTYVYNFTYWYAPYAWLPNPATYYFVQPYLKGFVYNTFSGYWYNTMYYTS
ncbi:MAG: ABC transporter substrate-binding protein [Thermoprotei archaeon]